MPTFSARRIAAAVCLALAAVLFCPTVSAGAVQPVPRATLVITLHGGLDRTGPVLDRAILLCDPTGGTHVAAEQACDTLREVDGDLGRLESTGALCPLVYDPVTVAVVGYWHRRVILFERTYDNACFAATESGDVFVF